MTEGHKSIVSGITARFRTMLATNGSDSATEEATRDALLICERTTSPAELNMVWATREDMVREATPEGGPALQLAQVQVETAYLVCAAYTLLTNPEAYQKAGFAPQVDHFVGVLAGWTLSPAQAPAYS